MRQIPTWCLTLCHRGEKLCKTVGVNRAGNPITSYCFEPSGTHVAEREALSLLKSGKFEPAGDGLFEVETSQTWRLKGAGAGLNSRPHRSPTKREIQDG